AGNPDLARQKPRHWRGCTKGWSGNGRRPVARPQNLCHQLIPTKEILGVAQKDHLSRPAPAGVASSGQRRPLTRDKSLLLARKAKRRHPMVKISCEGGARAAVRVRSETAPRNVPVSDQTRVKQLSG